MATKLYQPLLKALIFVGMPMRVKDLISWTNALCIGNCEENMIIQQWHYDSRKIFVGEQSIFLALKSKRHNGHDYLQEAYNRGVRLFLCSEKRRLPADACILIVSDVIHALQKAAAAYRNLFNIPIIAITGSNGKTIVKEWLFQILCHDLTIVRSPRSFNSQLGLPLSVFELEEHARLGIFEAGISEKAEMQHLEGVLHPEIGVFTTLGDAHDAGFSSRNEKLREKLLLFRHSKTIIYCKDQVQVHEAMVKTYGKTHQLFCWSETDQNAAVYVNNIEKNQTGLTIQLQLQPDLTTTRIQIPFSDRASMENALSTFCAIACIGKLNAEVITRFSKLQAIEMRLQQKEGIGDSKLLLDFYNSDQLGLEHALDQLVNMYPDREKIVILSDFDQQSVNPELYQGVLKKLNERNINRCFGIGEHWCKVSSEYPITFQSFRDTQSFLLAFSNSWFNGAAILIKGGRRYTFEKLAARFQQQLHNTRLEVDLSAMRHNLNVYRRHLRSGQKIMVMVKALAYGSGSHRVARMLQYEGVDYLAVAYTDEGVSLRAEGITLPIMVMSPTVEDFQTMLEYELEPDIYSISLLKEFGQAIRQSACTHAGLHLEFDTGMHRLGFSLLEVQEIIDLLGSFPELQVKSVFSHFASSDEPDHTFSHQQLSAFKAIQQAFENSLNDNTLYHMANSAGILAYNSDAHLNMVRLGIGLYGYDPRQEIQAQLETAIRLKSYVVQLRKVKAGEGIGYGQKHRASFNRTIAVVALGYADGYFRRFSTSKAWVSIRSKKAYLAGSVCMDMFMCDVSDIEGVQVNDEVEVWGESPSLIEAAEWAETIPYEILTAVSNRVQRVYLQE